MTPSSDFLIILCCLWLAMSIAMKLKNLIKVASGNYYFVRLIWWPWIVDFGAILTITLTALLT